MQTRGRGGMSIADFASPLRLARLVRRARRIRRYLAGAEHPGLHLGCGEHALAGWLNTDLVLRCPDAVYMDARRPFPLPTARFERVFTEHLIEHLGYAEAASMLREVYRVLLPGGWLRIATPDLRFLLGLHRSDRSALEDRYLDWAIGHSGLEHEGGPRAALVINHFFRAWEHRFIYDRETLIALLERTGFVEIGEREIHRSPSPQLRDLEAHGRIIPEEFNRLETFVVEARRPEGG